MASMNGISKDWVYYSRLLYVLAKRDLLSDFKDTALGLLWLILQPMLLMVTFSIVRSFLKFGSDGIPYPLSSFLAISVWLLHVSILQGATPSIERNAGIIKKMPVPRILFPLSGAIVQLIEYFVTWIPFVGLLIYYDWPLSASIVYLPLMILLSVAFSLGLGLLISAFSIFKRDLVLALPYLMQLWLFLSPVIYPLSHVPEEYRGLYSLNPMVGIVEGYRSVVLKGTTPDWALLAPSACAIGIVWVLASIVYPRLSRYFADVL